MPDSSPVLAEEMLLGQYIPLHYHFNMLQDRTRMEPFREAIEMVVPRGGRVLELGGGTGVLSWFAAQRAARVWCVERNPALVRAARSFLAQNQNGERVEVIQADAMNYLPPEPVDVVVCEMLHAGLIREKQTEVLRSFKARYTAAFGPKLPAFIPDTTLLGVLPVQQDFCFSGYTAAVPMFLAPGFHHNCRGLADPAVFATVSYDTEIPTELGYAGRLPIHTDGIVNALQFQTKNFLAYDLDAGRAVEWPMPQLVLPLAQPQQVRAGESLELNFRYRAGCELETMQSSLYVKRHIRSKSRAA